MTRPAILITESEGFSQAALDVLKEVGYPILVDVDRESLIRLVIIEDIIWVRLRHFIDAKVMEAGHKLQIIVTPTTGLNHIAVDQAYARNIKVLSLRGETEFLRNVR